MMYESEQPNTQPVSPLTFHASRLTYLALGAIILLALVLHFYNLDQEGFSNLYYAATVKSMLMNWHNFFFASYDPGGFVSVDKPPLGFWVQALSATLLGFNGFALLLPQAMAGVLSIVLLYHLVARVFGAWAGVIAALVLTVTPISIAANRNNTMDSQLVLTSLLAAWAVSIAVEKGKLRWLLLCALFVGLGFNIKMLQAVMVLPAFWLVYLVAAKTAWWKRIAHLAIATLVLAIVSLAWVIAFDATPADQRPFAGSSRNNSMMELVTGHNGLTRLGQIANVLGLRGPAPARPADAPNPPIVPPPYPPVNPPGQDPPHQPNAQPAGQPQPSAPGQNGETGDPGLFRLFNKQLVGQVSWLLPLALAAIIIALLASRITPHTAYELYAAILLWSVWLIPQLVFFSFAGLFHRYYLEMLSPAIAALVGAGVAAMWTLYRRHQWRGMILPIAFLITAITQVVMLTHFPDWSRWLTPTILGITMVGCLALVLLRAKQRLSLGAFIFCLLACLIAPTIWSFTPVVNGGDSGLPFAGPELLARRGGGNTIQTTNPLVDYLRRNRYGAEYLVATTNAQTASPLILATGEPVMAMGGFGGNDNILTPTQLAQYVADNTVRFFWLSQDNNQQANLVRWIRQNCSVVQIGVQQQPPRGQNNPPQPQPGNNAQQLYQCAK